MVDTGKTIDDHCYHILNLSKHTCKQTISLKKKLPQHYQPRPLAELVDLHVSADNRYLLGIQYREILVSLDMLNINFHKLI